MATSTIKEFHDSLYSENILNLDAQGNTFEKISSLWIEDPRPQNILDLGCGAGAVTSELVRRGHAVYGLDIQDEAVRRASTEGLHAQVWDLNQGLPFDDQCFDVAVATDVIEHVFDPLALLREVHRTLKDEGYAILGIPQHFDILQRLWMLFGKGIVTAEYKFYCADYRSWNYAHIRLFTLRECFQVVRAAGFKVEKSELLGIPLFPYPLPYRAALSVFCNRYSRWFFPSLFSGGVRLRARKRFRAAPAQ
jgi:2-polyprenyl-3-methyl-5-hydroxy-6-metoxy-1,4-benzoquinol methylase